MKRLFLTSSVDSVAHDLHNHIDINANKNLVFINTAAELDPEEDRDWEKDDAKALENAGFSVSWYTISGKDKEALRNDLSGFDVIYMSGGNTYYLLQQAQISGFEEVVKELVNNGKIYVGTSAGSIIAGPNIEPVERLEKLEEAPKINGLDGFGFVNFVILPHWGSGFFKDLYLNYRMEHTYKKSQFPMIVLTDSQYVKVEDEKFEIIDVDRK